MPDLAAILLLAARVLRVYRERPITASIMTRIMIVAIPPNYARGGVGGGGAGVAWQQSIITHCYPSNQCCLPICLFSLIRFIALNSCIALHVNVEYQRQHCNAALQGISLYRYGKRPTPLFF